MNILITGANGFLGNYFKSFFNSRYTVRALGRDKLDICDESRVIQELATFMPDAIIHCAASGRYTPSTFDPKVLYNNIVGFKNIALNKRDTTKLINIGSGAEFSINSPLNEVNESDVFKYLPEHSYGLSKNLIARMIQTNQFINTYNLRLFGCFDSSESDTRVLKILKKNLENGKEFILDQDRMFDMVWAYDVGVMVEKILNDLLNEDSLDFNCVYSEKMLFSDILKLFIKTHKLDESLLKINKLTTLNYTGSANKISCHSKDFRGLEEGFRHYNE
jgi:nucleoside-diphosphate-sugar epimerase